MKVSSAVQDVGYNMIQRPCELLNYSCPDLLAVAFCKVTKVNVPLLSNIKHGVIVNFYKSVQSCTILRRKFKKNGMSPMGGFSSLGSPTFNLFLTPVAGAFPSLSPLPPTFQGSTSAYGEKRQPILLGDETVL